MYKIIATKKYEYMLEDVLSHLWSTKYIRRVGLERHAFVDGEIYHRINVKDVAGEDVVLIGGTIDADETLELFDIGCSVVKHKARSLILFIPYFGYSTMERAVEKGEIVKAKTRARLLSSIPIAAAGTKIIFVDLHSEGIPHYLEGNILPEHLYAKDFVIDQCRKIGGSDFVLGSTDAGRAKWIESLANDMGVECALITKRRLSGTTTEITSINADVAGRVVIIYDDMIRTGGSLIKAADKYLEVGAREVHAIATHGVLPYNSIEKLVNSKLASISMTNTHPNAHELRDYDKKVNVFSIAQLLIKELSE